MRLLVLVLVASCWRAGNAPSVDAPPAPSFVARVTGLTELQHSTAALEPKLATVLRRILALTSEAERIAIRDQLQELTGDVAHLAARARGARQRGDDPMALARVEHRLAEAAETLVKLRHGLRYASSLEELQAMQQRQDDFAVVDWVPDSGRVDVVLSPVPNPTLSWRRGLFDRP